MELTNSNKCSMCCEIFCSSEKILVDEDLLKLLTYLVNNMDTTSIQNTLICEACSNKIQDACMFKMSYMENFQNTPIATELNNVCDICKTKFQKCSSVSLSVQAKYLIDYYLTDELELGVNRYCNICDSCQRSVLNIHFVMKLLLNINENEINNFKETHDVENSNNPVPKNKNDISENVNDEKNEIYENFLLKNEQLDLKIEEENIFTEQNVGDGQEDTETTSHNFDKIQETAKLTKRKGCPKKKNTDVDMFKCDNCDFKTKYKRYLKVHIKTHKDIQTFKCDVCEYKSNDKTNFGRHMLIHKNDYESEMFKCDFCDFKTKYKYFVKVHTRNQHMLRHKKHKKVYENEMLKCNLCEFKTKYKGSLHNHKNLHNNNKRIRVSVLYQCDVCDFKTKNKYYFKEHNLTHTNVNEVKTYKCDLCYFKTNRKAYLYAHQTVHKNEMFQCNLCVFKTKHKPYLKLHSRVHETRESKNIEMFKCDVCAYQTKKKNSLELHMSFHENVDGIKLYTCYICNHITKHKGGLRDHVKKHQNINDIEHFTCVVCQYKTKYKQNFKSHIQTFEHIQINNEES